MAENNISLQFEILSNSDENHSKVYQTLKALNHEYPVPLNQKINLKEYVKKIFTSGFVLVCFVSENIAGILTFYANDTKNKEGWYSLLGVLKKYRKLGVAKNLCMKSFIVMKENGMETVYSYTHKDNKKGISFYKKIGFQIDPKRPNWYDYNITFRKKI